MTARNSHPSLGPLFTLTDDELARPARRREDRDVLVLRIELEAQRREVHRLMGMVTGWEPVLHPAPANAAADPNRDRQLWTARDLRKAFGIAPSTLYNWIKDGTFPAQIHIGRLARWKASEVDAWIQTQFDERARKDVARGRPEPVQRVRGGRSRWAFSTASPPTIAESSGVAWEPRPTPVRGVGWRLQAVVPQPVPPEHPDYSVPRFRLDEAARYVGLPSDRQWDLRAIPHGRTTAMHYCFAQSDLDAFRATLKVRPKKNAKPDRENET